LNEELLREKLAAQAVARGIAREGLIERLERWAPNCVRLLV